MAKELRIRVPKVPKKAFNPDRPPSALVKSHVAQLQGAVLAAIDTEGEAATAIRAFTRLLQELRPLTVPVSHASTLRRRSRKRPSKSRTARKRGRK